MVLMIFTMDNHFQPLNIQSQIHLQQLWDHMMILFINIIIITLLPFLWSVWLCKVKQKAIDFLFAYYM